MISILVAQSTMATRHSSELELEQHRLHYCLVFVVATKVHRSARFHVKTELPRDEDAVLRRNSSAGSKPHKTIRKIGPEVRCRLQVYIC